MSTTKISNTSINIELLKIEQANINYIRFIKDGIIVACYYAQYQVLKPAIHFLYDWCKYVSLSEDEKKYIINLCIAFNKDVEIIYE